MAKYRAGVIGLGWMGMLYDMADRIGDFFNIDDVDRPTPELDDPSQNLSSYSPWERGSTHQLLQRRFGTARR